MNTTSGVGGALPLYRHEQEPAQLGNNGHKGLWFERFFDGYDDSFHELKETTKGQPDVKSQWIQTVANRTAGRNCQDAALRQLALCNNLNGKNAVYLGTWHFATGLGLPHPVENGFLWHPTLGVPYIPGAAVKGLLRAWMESWVEHENSEARRKKLHQWFGSEEKFPDAEKKQTSQLDNQAGNLIFFDALPVEPVTLKADIMTPHMGKWYEAGDEINDCQEQSERVPADWHDPNPIPFLVANKPQFLFSIAPRPGIDMSESSMGPVMQALGQALDWLGAGAKTAVGYGQFEENEKALEKLETELSKKTQERDKKRREEIKKREEEQAIAEAKAKLPQSVQDAISDYEQNGGSQKKSRYIASKIRDDKWQGKELVEILQWLKQEMQDSKEWKEVSKKTTNKDYQNTIFIKQKLEESQTI